jgi:carbon storage regulator CsrA
MLILTRRRNERIIINDNTIVTVKRIFGNRITVTVETLPANTTPVIRENIFKRIQNRFKPIA